MRFVPDHRLPAPLRASAVACDGPCEAALQLGHWPGSAAPARFRADLATEMALKLARAEERAALEVATNDHHDADGVLSLFCALRPDEALPEAERWVAAAAFSDFRHGSDEEALKLAATLDGFATSPLSPLAAKLGGLAIEDAWPLATEHALALLPGLAGDLERHWPLWSGELARFQASRDALQGGALALTELPDARLTVAEADDEPHPAVLDRAAQGDLVLLAARGGRGYRYRADWRFYSWAETASPARPRVARVSLEKFCLPLNALETNKAGRWMWEPPGAGRTEALRFCEASGAMVESALAPGEVAEKLAWFLVERRP